MRKNVEKKASKARVRGVSVSPCTVLTTRNVMDAIIVKKRREPEGLTNTPDSFTRGLKPTSLNLTTWEMEKSSPRKDDVKERKSATINDVDTTLIARAIFICLSFTLDTASIT
jgi:hypothetical protein